MSRSQGSLSPRELDVLRCVADGLTDKETAKRLGIAFPTVKVHMRTIFCKFGIHTRAGAVMAGVRLGLLDPHEQNGAAYPAEVVRPFMHENSLTR